MTHERPSCARLGLLRKISEAVDRNAQKAVDRGVVRPSRALRGLLALFPLVSLLGLLAELGAPRGLDAFWVELFSLSYEANLPTAYSATLLATSAALLGLHARDLRTARDRNALGFAALALLMLYVSIDEAVELHEHLASLYAGSGWLYFGWVVPGAIIVALLAGVFLPFVLRLSGSTRKAFLLAATVYVLGALGMELPLGYYTERYGDAGLGYGLIDWVEETLEMFGACLFVAAVDRERRALRAASFGGDA